MVRKQSLCPKDLKEAVADAIELGVDGVRIKVTKVVEQGFREWIPSRRRDVDRLGPTELNGLPTCIRELVVEGDPREDVLEVRSRVGSTWFDAKL
ncbi:hypothetical protein [Haloarcula rubra]|uniref:hypothetical protein n=1 Tax=Haloarcula rubra TaxID=2487747 RepID=UPI001F3B2C28|nr:hypothetical protein [Halomicroarcula rubra]